MSAQLVIWGPTIRKHWVWQPGSSIVSRHLKLRQIYYVNCTAREISVCACVCATWWQNCRPAAAPPCAGQCWAARTADPSWRRGLPGWATRSGTRSALGKSAPALPWRPPASRTATASPWFPPTWMPHLQMEAGVSQRVTYTRLKPGRERHSCEVRNRVLHEQTRID